VAKTVTINGMREIPQSSQERHIFDVSGLDPEMTSNNNVNGFLDGGGASAPTWCAPWCRRRERRSLIFVGLAGGHRSLTPSPELIRVSAHAPSSSSV